MGGLFFYFWIKFAKNGRGRKEERGLCNFNEKNRGYSRGGWVELSR